MPVEMLLIDEFEPDEIVELLRAHLPVSKVPLNRSGLADYSWKDSANQIEHVERKQIGELLGGLEEVEYQLVKEIQASPRLTLLIEGIAIPVGDGIDVYIQTKAMNSHYPVMRKGRHYKTPWSRLEGWLVALELKGIRVWRTPNLDGTALTLVRLYTHTRQPESWILQRHLKVPVGFHPNPYVRTMMGIEGAGLGAKLAEALIDTFETPWNVLTHTPEDIANFIPGIGIKSAKQIFKAFGKEV